MTVLREGLEAVIFLGGVSLGQEAKSIPIAAIVGLLCGFSIGLVIWFFSHRRLNIRCVGRANRTDPEKHLHGHLDLVPPAHRRGPVLEGHRVVRAVHVHEDVRRCCSSNADETGSAPTSQRLATGQARSVCRATSGTSRTETPKTSSTVRISLVVLLLTRQRARLEQCVWHCDWQS